MGFQGEPDTKFKIRAVHVCTALMHRMYVCTCSTRSNFEMHFKKGHCVLASSNMAVRTFQHGSLRQQNIVRKGQRGNGSPEIIHGMNSIQDMAVWQCQSGNGSMEMSAR